MEDTYTTFFMGSMGPGMTGPCCPCALVEFVFCRHFVGSRRRRLSGVARRVPTSRPLKRVVFVKEKYSNLGGDLIMA